MTLLTWFAFGFADATVCHGERLWFLFNFIGLATFNERNKFLPKRTSPSDRNAILRQKWNHIFSFCFCFCCVLFIWTKNTPPPETYVLALQKASLGSLDFTSLWTDSYKTTHIYEIRNYLFVWMKKSENVTQVYIDRSISTGA